MNFNSIKVQLKPKQLCTLLGYGKFQFHKGTIKTNISIPLYLNFEEFQFHKGTIKT